MDAVGLIRRFNDSSLNRSIGRWRPSTLPKFKFSTFHRGGLGDAATTYAFDHKKPLANKNRGSSLNSIPLPDTFHQDPADRLIVATARSLKIPLATQDRKIITSRLTRIWK